MRLTFHTDYALRVLVYLAVNSGRPAKIADIAISYGISRNHLLKIALRLSRLGYVRTTRGRSGGIELAQNPDAIGLGDVVRLMEGDMALVECARKGGGACPISPVCRIRGILGRGLDAFLTVLDGHSLADLAADRSGLAPLLGLPAEEPLTA